MNILVLDDEREIADLVEVYLKNENYNVFKFYDAKEAINCIESQKLDFAILDVMIKDVDGFKICKMIRDKGLNFPVIMLTAKIEDKDKIQGLTLGADDYITKPFNPLELIARVKSAYRRYTKYNEKSEENIIYINGLEIDQDKHICRLYETQIELTPMEFDILLYLAQKRGNVVSSEELFEKVWKEKYLENNNKDLKDIKKGVLPILGVLFLVFALIMLEPDFGTGIVIVMTIIVLLFVSGVKMNFFIKLGVLGLLGVVVLVIIAPYRMERIISFINPWSDPLGSGFQIIQSLYAIGPGGLLGLGFGNSVQKHFYLPEPQTDFIFSIISEEFGFLGVIIVATLFITIIYSGFKIAMNCEDKFGKYLAFGITFGLAFQTMLNLMVVVGLIPVTGVTLPFLSYGGSSLLISLTSIGILLNISA